MKPDIDQKLVDEARKKFDWMNWCPVCGAKMILSCSVGKWDHFEVNWMSRGGNVILFSKDLGFWNLIFSSFDEADEELRRILKLQAFR